MRGAIIIGLGVISHKCTVSNHLVMQGRRLEHRCAQGNSLLSCVCAVGRMRSCRVCRTVLCQDARRQEELASTGCVSRLCLARWLDLRFLGQLVCSSSEPIGGLAGACSKCSALPSSSAVRAFCKPWQLGSLLLQATCTYGALLPATC